MNEIKLKVVRECWKDIVVGRVEISILLHQFSS